MNDNEVGQICPPTPRTPFKQRFSSKDGCHGMASPPSHQICKGGDETTVGTHEDLSLSMSFHSVSSDAGSVSTTRSSITHPPTSSRQARLRKLNGKRMSLREAMLDRYNKRQADLEECDDYDVIQRLRDYDCGSTLATLESSSMDFTMDPAPGSSSSSVEEERNTAKNEAQEMEDVMKILQAKLGFSPVAVVGSQHPRLSSIITLPFDEADEKQEEVDDQVVSEECGSNNDDDDDLRKEMEEMESVMLAMKNALGFKPVPMVGRA